MGSKVPSQVVQIYNSLSQMCQRNVTICDHKHIFHDCVTLSRPKKFLPPSCHILQLDYNLFESQMNPPNKVVSCQIRQCSRMQVWWPGPQNFERVRVLHPFWTCHFQWLDLGTMVHGWVWEKIIFLIKIHANTCIISWMMKGGSATGNKEHLQISQTDIKGLLLDTIRLFCILDNYALVSSNAMAA